LGSARIPRAGKGDSLRDLQLVAAIAVRRRANAQQIASPAKAPQMSIITSFGDPVRDGTND